MCKRESLVGRKFGRLTITAEQAGHNRKNARVLCLCDCGVTCWRDRGNVRRGATRSCGCYKRERIMPLRRTHGMFGTAEYRAWAAIKTRCYNQKSKDFPRWGGRGITVCDRWLHSFMAFYEDMGPRPEGATSIDRKDSNGPYSPDNCRWATWADQARNTGQNVWVMFGGERTKLVDLAAKYGVRSADLRRRLRLGWSIEKAIGAPIKHCHAS